MFIKQYQKAEILTLVNFMKKNVKKGLLIGGGILVVLLILLFTVPLLFKGKIKDAVINAANEKLNAELFIKDFGISAFSNFPNITLSLEDMSVSGVGDFARDTLVKAKSANITLSLWEIIRGNYAVSRINMDQAQVYAKVLADGRVNWDIMKTDSVSAETVNNDTDSGDGGFKLQLQKVSLNHCKLLYEDQSLNMKVLLSDWSGEVSGDFTAKNTTLKTKSTIGEVSFTMDGIPYLSRIKGLADATVDVDMDKIKLTFVESNIQLNDVKASLDGTFSFVGDDGKYFDLKLKAPDTQFKDILSILPALYTNDFKDLKTSGTASLEGYVKGLMQGDHYPAFDFKILIQDAMFKYPSLPKSVDNINVIMGISSTGGDLDNVVLDISKFDFTMAGNPFSASLNIKTPMSDANLKAKMKGIIDLSMIKDVYPLEKGTDLNGKLTADLNVVARMSAIEKEQYQNIDANGSLKINNMQYKSTASKPILINNAELQFSPQFVNLSTFDIKIGDNDLSANGCLENLIAYVLKNKTLKGELHLKSSYFNLNDFMDADKNTATASAAPSENKEKTSSGRTSPSSDNFMIPQNLNFSMDADMKHIVYGKTNINNLRGVITVKDGIARMQNVSANVLGGVAKISGAYNTAESVSAPKADLALNISKASFAETFKSVEAIQKFAPIFEKMLGNYSMDINLNTSMGSNISQMLGSLTASGLIQSNEVKVQNVEILNELASALKSNSLKSITAKDVNIPFAIKDGKINTKPFAINIGDGGKLSLEGMTGLDQTINYKGSVTLPKNMSKNFVNAIPLTITGTFNDPKIKVDAKSVIGSIAGQLLGGTSTGNGKTDNISSKITQNKQEQIAKIRSEAKTASEKVVEEAQKAGQQLIDAAAPKGAIAKLAADKAAAKLNSEAKKNAQKLLDESEEKVKLLEN